jgi:hypothetical protein
MGKAAGIVLRRLSYLRDLGGWDVRFLFILLLGGFGAVYKRVVVWRGLVTGLILFFRLSSGTSSSSSFDVVI